MYQGVVEDRNDPDQLGRVRVRFVGVHTEDKQKIATEDLPWAYPTCIYIMTNYDILYLSHTR